MTAPISGRDLDAAVARALGWRKPCDRIPTSLARLVVAVAEREGGGA